MLLNIGQTIMGRIPNLPTLKSFFFNSLKLMHLGFYGNPARPIDA
jgi:hypothetical protein